MENKKEELRILLFNTTKDWEQWLRKNHSATKAIWLRMHKKTAGIASVTYVEALEVALCYGWIDGTAKKYDETSYVQRFTPRRPKSIWSKKKC